MDTDIIVDRLVDIFGEDTAVFVDKDATVSLRSHEHYFMCFKTNKISKGNIIFELIHDEDGSRSVVLSTSYPFMSDLFREVMDYKNFPEHNFEVFNVAELLKKKCCAGSCVIYRNKKGMSAHCKLPCDKYMEVFVLKKGIYRVETYKLGYKDKKEDVKKGMLLGLSQLDEYIETLSS